MTFRDFLGAALLSPICGALLALALGACARPPEPGVLVGTGCGPDGLTMAAEEEDLFPFDCDAIEPIAVIRAER